MRTARLTVDGVPQRWVWVAGAFGDRLRGLIGRPSGAAIAIPGSSVHGWGMTEEIRVVGIDRRGRVIGSEPLRPCRFVRIPGAAWVVELPLAEPAPPIGSMVVLDLGFVRCPDA